MRRKRRMMTTATATTRTVATTTRPTAMRPATMQPAMGQEATRSRQNGRNPSRRYHDPASDPTQAGLLSLDAILDSIFKAYDVRGIYPDELDEALARRIGNVFAHFTGAQRVVVGRDMRPSSEPLASAFIEGAVLAGADVTDVGLCSTDVVYYA